RWRSSRSAGWGERSETKGAYRLGCPLRTTGRGTRRLVRRVPGPRAGLLGGVHLGGLVAMLDGGVHIDRRVVADEHGVLGLLRRDRGIGSGTGLTGLTTLPRTIASDKRHYPQRDCN